MGGVAGHAGLFSTAADLSIFCRMLLNGGSLDGARILSPAAVQRMTMAATPAGVKDVRGLGWDIDSSDSGNRGDLFPIGTSFGHTGWTGTSLWLDPHTKGYVIFLSNRVHPDGTGDVTALRGEVASIAAAVLSEMRTGN
jgi:CubicO group peptidase (beta-lactamase class C family)